MEEEDLSIKNLTKVTKIMEVPVYSNIRLVNGQMIAVVEDVVEMPVEWLEDKEGV